MQKKRIILLTNPDKPQALTVGRELISWFEGRVDVVGENITSPLDFDNLPRADFIVVLGGDGTILSTARSLGVRQIPLIGVNMGKLGFLAEFSVDELKTHFDDVISQDQPCCWRVMLNCRVIGPGRDEFVSTVVNEVAITAGPPFRMIDVSVSIADEHLAFCAGDGLIVSTPTGSTAYNLSAGGPILAASLQAAVITPLAAHSLSFRPVVVDLDRPIVLRCRNIHLAGANDKGEVPAAVVVVDGQVHTPLRSMDEVVITPHPARLMLVKNPAQSQWRLLNAKLHWGSLPNYGHPATD